MASFDNLATIDPWMFKSTIDPWFPANEFAIETESALTKALQQSLYNHPITDSFLPKQIGYCNATGSASTVTASGSGSGSDPETPRSKRLGSDIRASICKPTKRRTRASKRSVTTYIQADPSNFRQMVQQVTGVKFDANRTLPEREPLPQPFVSKLQGLLPTLDSSAYLPDLQNSDTHQIPASGAASSAIGFSKFPRSQVTENGGAGVDYYSCSSFPTLESSI